MAALYRFGAARRMRYLVAPQLAPFLLVAVRNGLSLTWKIVLVAELLGRSSGIGFQLQIFFQNFDVTRILADDGISIVAMIQREPGEGEEQTDIIMLTHKTRERNIDTAIAGIESLPAVKGRIIRLRLEELL